MRTGLNCQALSENIRLFDEVRGVFGQVVKNLNSTKFSTRLIEHSPKTPQNVFYATKLRPGRQEIEDWYIMPVSFLHTFLQINIVQNVYSWYILT